MSAPHADRDNSEQPVAGPLCARCGQPALGFATINGVRYCHADERSCYTEQCHENPTHARMKVRLDARKAARQVRASEAQVEAALDVLGCGAYQNRRGVVVCIHERHEHYGAWSERGCPVAAVVADAVVAADPDADEVTRLRAEVEEWKRADSASCDLAARYRQRAEAAEAERDEIAGRLSALLCELTGGRLSKTTYDVPTMVAEIDSVYDDAHQEDWDELERLAEVVARVEALAETMANEHGQSWNSITARRIRIHLSGPTPAETPQNGPEPALSREQGTSGQSGEGGALRGAENGEWRARCDVPGCGWFSLPYKAREGADKAGYNHWLSKGHGSTIRGRR